MVKKQKIDSNTASPSNWWSYKHDERWDTKHAYSTTYDKDMPLHDDPHYTDKRFDKEQTIFGKPIEEGSFGHQGLDYVYSDRIWQWDYNKAKRASQHANDTTGKTGHNKSCRWYEIYLSYFFDKPVVIEHIIAGVNRSNGYSYCVFGYKEAPQKEG